MQMSVKRAYAVVVAALGLWLTPGHTQAAPEAKVTDLSLECVGKEAQTTLMTCPGGPAKFDAKQKRAVAFKSAPPPREVRERKDDVKPDEEHVIWPFDGEYWRDELGFYRQTITSKWGR